MSSDLAKRIAAGWRTEDFSESAATRIPACGKCGVRTHQLRSTDGGLRICVECIQASPTCGGCQALLWKNEGKLWGDGERYCRECTKNLHHCGQCGFAILGPSVESLRGHLCRVCSERLPRCGCCGRAISQRCHKHGERLFCIECVEANPLCLGCGTLRREPCSCGGALRICVGCRTKTGVDWCLDASNSWICYTCYIARLGYCPHCRCEDREAVKQWGCCSECKAEEVAEYSQALEILQEVREYCIEQFGMRVERPYHLLLAHEAARHRAGSSMRATSLGRGWCGLYQGRGHRVWVMSNIPTWLFTSILAHEHTHAWQRENCEQQSLELVEGLACWVEWKVLLHLGRDRMAAERLASQEPYYGPGLRQCVQLEEEVGQDGMLAAVMGLREFPAPAESPAVLVPPPVWL